VQRRIGLPTTKRMMMTGSELSAIEAKASGLIDLLAPAGELDSLVEDLANEIIANSWHTNFAVKRLMIEADGMSLAQALAHEHFRYPGWAPDHAQRIAAFTSSKPKRDG
jgi:enoyl-CoA hydratase